MKKLFKILLILTALVGVIFSVCIFSVFYNVPFFTDMIKTNWDIYPQLNFAFGVYNVSIGLLFIILLTVAVIMPVGPNFLKIKNDKGELFYSKKTVESIAKISFADLADTEFSKVKAKFGRSSDKAKIYVVLSPKNTNELSTVTETIQNRIEASLLSSLGITVKYVKIKVMESKLTNTSSIIYNRVTEQDTEPKPESVVETVVETGTEDDVSRSQAEDIKLIIDEPVETETAADFEENEEENADENTDDVKKDAVIVSEGGAL